MYKYSDIAILYRTNSQAGVVQRALAKAGVPYKIQGGMGFWDQREVKDMVALLSWIVNPSDAMSLERASKNLKLKCAAPSVVNRIYDSVNLGTVTLEDLEQSYQKVISTSKETTNYLGFKKILDIAKKVKNKTAGEAIEELFSNYEILKTLKKEDAVNSAKDFSREESAEALLQMAKKDNNSIRDFIDTSKLDTEDADNNKNAVTLATIHKSKGKEFSIVFVINCSDDILPHKMVYADIQKLYGDITGSEIRSTPEYRQELNAMYVAQTRAKKLLYMTHCLTRKLYNKTEQLKLSPLLLNCLATIKEKGNLQISDEEHYGQI